MTFPLTPERVAELRDAVADHRRLGWVIISTTTETVAALLAAAEERDAYRKAKQENDERFMRERDQARADRDALLALVERASTDSVVTTADDPGCFYCNHVEHTKRCTAAAAIRAAKGQP